VPIRKNSSFQGGWFWRAGQDSTLRSLEELDDIYYKSVGRNTNLLLGIVINDKGLVPKADVQLLKQFGNSIKQKFSTALAETSGQGNVFTLDFDNITKVNTVLLMEDIKNGERVRKYVIKGFVDDAWIELCKGSSIGHKRLERLENISVSKIKVSFPESIAQPIMRRISIY